MVRGAAPSSTSKAGVFSVHSFGQFLSLPTDRSAAELHLLRSDGILGDREHHQGLEFSAVPLFKYAVLASVQGAVAFPPSP